MRFVAVSVAVVVALLCTGCAGIAATSGRVSIGNEKTSVDISINPHDRMVIEQYFTSAKKQKKLPPGLAKRGGNLPPGLAKRQKLPPGLRGEPLPVELERQLTRLPTNYVRVRVGNDIVLMDGRTRVVFDMVYDIPL